MRIALLCPNVSSNSLVRTYPIAKVLGRRHELQVLGFRFGGDVFPPYAEEFDYETLEARALPAFLRQVKDLAQRVRADAIYAFKPLPSSLWVGLMTRRRLRIPLFLDIEDWEVGWYHDVPLHHRLRHLAHVERPNGYLWTRVTEKLTHQADEVFVVSRFLQRRFGGTLLVHGADTSVFDPGLIDRRNARRHLGFEDHRRYIVFTGSPMPSKGLDDLLQAVRQLGNTAVRVVIVGSFRHDPTYGERLSREHGDRLLIVGPRPHAEMPLYLSAADLVVLPQRITIETRAQVPGKIFEAMAMARPILATAVSDLPEILDGCGILVSPGSVDALVDGIGRVLDTPLEGERLGHAARARCQERYSWDAMETILDARIRRWEGARRAGPC